MWVTRSSDAILFGAFCLLIKAATAYNRPECDAWPSEAVWRGELESQLSPQASLTAVGRSAPSMTINNKTLSTMYEETCFPLGFDPYQIANTSICLQDPKCAYQFCDTETHQMNEPAYILTATTVQDVQAGLAFANRYDIPVSIKTSGHSFHGGSTAKDSLLIWMHQFRKDDRVRNVTDSCGNTYTAVGIGGGELWDDVLYAVKDDYHLVTGFCHTVGAAGGWLQGHGLSFTSRRYGLGIDHVVRMRVVLPNGTRVVVDECTNPDLFWALRGGGGGTFGVVTLVQYKLHPVTPITLLAFHFDIPTAVSKGRDDLIKLWLSYWISVAPTLDERWGGLFNANDLYITFTGTRQEAMDTFGSEMMDWYTNVFLPSANTTDGLLITAPEATEYPSWYQFVGGDAAYRNPEMTIPMGGEYNHTAQLGSRLVPLDFALAHPEALANFLANLAKLGTLTGNYFLGGNINKIAPNATATHPAVRQAIFNIGVQDFTKKSYALLQDFLPNSITGASFNHHYALESDWRNSLWGSNYDRLAELKERYDPGHRLNCWHCVGYQGPDPEDPSYTEAECP
jgi:hypothetical protein